MREDELSRDELAFGFVVLELARVDVGRLLAGVEPIGEALFRAEAVGDLPQSHVEQAGDRRVGVTVGVVG